MAADPSIKNKSVLGGGTPAPAAPIPIAPAAGPFGGAGGAPHPASVMGPAPQPANVPRPQGAPMGGAVHPAAQQPIRPRFGVM